MDWCKRSLLSLVVALVVSAGGNIALAQATKTQAVSLYNLGLTAYKQGSPESAIIFFKRAADIDPDLADAQYNLGVLYQSEKRLKEAIPRFQEVLRVKPSDADAHYQLGVAYIDLGRIADAREQLTAIAPNSPHFSESQKKLSLLNDQAAGQPSYRPLGQTPVEPPTQTPNQQAQVQPQVQLPPQPAPNYQALQTPATIQPSLQSPSQSPVQPQTQTSNPVAAIPNATIKVVATGFAAPAGLAFDKQGNLYIANFLSNAIDRITLDGTRSQFSMGVNLKGPIGMVIDDSGSLYVANYIGGYISRINPAGISSIIATGFKKPYYLTLDRDGSLFVSQQEDNSVVRITLPKPSGVHAQLPDQLTK